MLLGDVTRRTQSSQKNTTVSVAKVDKNREASDADLTLCQVKCLILDGWPKSIKAYQAKLIGM